MIEQYLPHTIVVLPMSTYGKINNVTSVIVKFASKVDKAHLEK